MSKASFQHAPDPPWIFRTYAHCLAASVVASLATKKSGLIRIIGTPTLLHIGYSLSVFTSFAVFGRQGILGLTWVLAVTLIIAIAAAVHEHYAAKARAEVSAIA